MKANLTLYIDNDLYIEDIEITFDVKIGLIQNKEKFTI